MTLRVRVHVDDDGNAVVPVGKQLHGQDVELRIEVATEGPACYPPDGASDSHSQDADFDAYLDTLRKIRPPQPEPRAFTAEEQAARLAEFDALTGAWQGEFPEPDDAPPESGASH